MKILAILVLLLAIGATVYFGILPYMPSVEKLEQTVESYADSEPQTTPKETMPVDPREIEKERILKEHDGKTDYLTDEEKRKVYYKEYEEAENTPEFAYWVTLVLVITGFSAIFGGNKDCLKISLFLCLILLFFSWKLIALALLIDVVLIPTLMCMGVKGLSK